MFPTFFKHKAKEVLSFLHIMKGKVTGNDEVRKQGVDEALRAMDEEREVYLNEKREAERNIDSDVPGRKKSDNSSRETGQDISAI
jgi:hypothetical protein